jgi:acyl-CoA synthetase (NDP forming)
VIDPQYAFRKFFYPDNVVVIGVSPEMTNLGRNIVKNLMDFGYRGEVLSVGIKGGVLYGQRIYHSMDSIDRKIDLAVILTPARTIPGILEQCGRKGIRHVVIESGGFSEMGEDGTPLEEACITVAERFGIRFIGPNGIGITNMENGLALPFWPLREDLTKGPVSVLAQSGGVGLSYLGFLADESVGLNKFISMGNKLNVDENDLLGYLIRDEGTEIILVYLEGFTNGRRFMGIASRSDKPILVHKSNRFTASAQIAHSHTAALFADDQLVDFALEQVGCVRVNTMADALDHIKILTLPHLRGTRLAVVSRSGGHAVIAADACAHYGFSLPPFPQAFLQKIESRFRAHVIRLQNPLDLGDLFDLAFYENIVEEILRREDVDGVLLVHGYRPGFEQEASRSLAKKVEELVERYHKPVAFVVFTEAVELDHLRRHLSIPIFTAPENAMRAIHLSHMWASRERNRFPAQASVTLGPSGEKSILEQAVGRDFLFLDECLHLLKTFGFSVTSYQSANTPDEAVRAWRNFARPVAVKVNRPHVSHKTDAGLVMLNLDSEREIHHAFEALEAKVTPENLEILVQPMITDGREVVLGGKQDEVFGPVILFGLGGTLVEVMGDVVWRVAPISIREAREMLREIKGWRVLAGTRGQGHCDMDALEDALIRLSHLLVEFRLIQEIDINPVKVGDVGHGAQVLDARIILRKSM